MSERHRGASGPSGGVGLLSVVVVSYETPRELPRTLYSLSPRFQVGIAADQYEVIVVDNGSRRPPVASDHAELGLDLTVLRVPDPTPSPARAVNLGIGASCGDAVGVMIDGARLASRGLLRAARDALATNPRAVVGSRGRYLGPMMQRRSMTFGYDQSVEDALLDRIDWRANGDDLFAISVFDEVSRPVWYGQVGESNSLFMRRPLWRELGGYDEAFTTPGGGFVNLDTWDRACRLPDVSPILLLGEATFHQFHGGVATNVPRSAVDVFRDEYIRLRGHDHVRPDVPVSLWGAFRHTPPIEELIPNRGRTAEERMDGGPMLGLLDLARSEAALAPSAGAGATPAGSATDRPGRRRVRSRVRRVVGPLWRRVPHRVRRGCHRAVSRVARGRGSGAAPPRRT